MHMENTKTGVAHAGQSTEVKTASTIRQDDSRTQAIVESTALRGFSNRRYAATSLRKPFSVEETRTTPKIIQTAPWEEILGVAWITDSSDRLVRALLLLENPSTEFVFLSTAAEIAGNPEMASVLLEFNGFVRKRMGPGEPSINLDELFAVLHKIDEAAQNLRP